MHLVGSQKPKPVPGSGQPSAKLPRIAFFVLRNATDSSKGGSN